MDDLQHFLEYIFSKKDDTRISIAEYVIDEKNKRYTLAVSSPDVYKAHGSFEISFDLSTSTIVMDSYPMEDIIIRDYDFCKKWVDIIESHLNIELDKRINSMINKSLEKEHLKDIHRSWKLKKIIQK